MDDKFFLSMVDKFNSMVEKSGAAAITEFEFTEGTTRFVLRRESGQIVERTAPAPVGNESAAGSALAGSGATDHSVRLGLPANAAGEVAGEGEMIKSPIVATYYSSPSPDAPPFVKPGSKIKAGQTLCILEAMKMMNHLEAEFDCEIIQIHASGGELVEYGQELFTVKRS